MGRYGQLAANTILIGIGSFSSKVLTFLCVPLYTALLTTEQYGVADIITTTSILVFQVLTLSISEGLMRYCLEDGSDKRSIFSVSIVITLIGFIVLAALAPFAVNIAAIAECYPLFLIYYIGYTLYTTISYFARGIESIAAYSICGVLNTVLTVGLNLVFLVLLHAGLLGYIAAYGISFTVSALVLFLAVRGYRYCTLKGIRLELIHDLISYSIPMIPNGISWWVSNSAGLYTVMLFCGASASGIYSAAQKIPAIIYALCGIFMTAWRISSVKGFGSAESKDFYAHILQGMLAFSSVLTALLIVFVKPVASIMYAVDFQDAWVYVPFLTIAVYYHSMDEFFGSVYTSALRTKMLFISAIAGAAANVLLCLALVPIIGLYGAAIASLTSYILIYVVRDAHTEQFFPFPRFRKEQIACTALLLLSAFSITHLEVIGVVLSVMAAILIVAINRHAFGLVLRVVRSRLITKGESI